MLKWCFQFLAMTISIIRLEGVKIVLGARTIAKCF